MRLDALEIGDIESKVFVENALEEQGRRLREYRFLMNKVRRKVVRDRMLQLMDDVDGLLRVLDQSVESARVNDPVPEPNWSLLKEAVQELATLLGGDPQPAGWGYLMRHLHFGQVADLSDILRDDWPLVKAGLRSVIYGEHDPVPVGVLDLEDILAARPQGPVTSKLNWSALTAEQYALPECAGPLPGQHRPLRWQSDRCSRTRRLADFRQATCAWHRSFAASPSRPQSRRD